MTDITNGPRFQRILLEAAQYRTLRTMFEAAERRLEHIAVAKDTADESPMIRDT